MRKEQLFKNTCTGLIEQLCTIINGFVLPRLFIKYYGSDTNGLISSITQFLAFFSLMEMGVGIVIKTSLYKPLAEKNNDEISRVIIASKNFFNKIGIGMINYSIAIMLYFVFGVRHTLGNFATLLLVGSIALSMISKYMFGISYRLLLFADQKNYINLWINIFITLCNLVISILLIKIECGIEVVKLVSSIINLLQPILLKRYVDNHYNLNLKIKITEDPLKQKGSAFAQYIAQYISKNTDVIILTIFSSLENVSIYSVYHLVTNGLQQLIQSTMTGMNALLGNMYAKNEVEKLQETFEGFEWIIHTIIIYFYSIAYILVLPFVKIYTKNVTDINYIIPTFGHLIIVASAVYCLRIPYSMMVNIAGHFKQTRFNAIMEAVLNVMISALSVRKFGLIGVSIGTLISIIYCTIYLAWYLQNNILNRSFGFFIKLVVTDIISFVVVVIVNKHFVISEISWMAWIVMAFKVSIIAIIIIAAINCFFYGNKISQIIKLFRNRKAKL
jgi:hypothetical protein